MLCLSAGITTFSFAQTPITPPTGNRTQLDTNTVVKDSTGRQYSYKEWSSLLKSRKYFIRSKGLKTADGRYSEYLLYPLSDAQIQHFVARTRSGPPENGQIGSATTYRTKFVEPRKPAESTQFHAGDVFKPFNEKDINGVKFNLKKDIGKVHVINFWFIGCPPCRAEIPDLNKIVDHYKDNKDVVFIAICLDEAYDIQNYLKMQPYNYHIIDGGRYIAAKYGVQLYPTNLVVNRDGKVAYSSVSNQPANPYWITKTIDEALQAPVSSMP